MAAPVGSFGVGGVDVAAVLPHVIVAAGGIFVLLAGAGVRQPHPRLLSAFAGMFVLASGAVLFFTAGGPRLAFDGAVAADGFAVFLEAVFLAAALLTVIASMGLLTGEQVPATEYLGVMLMATSGMMLMASAADLVVVFLALETFSLGLYILAAVRRRLDGQEGALKYFLTGSFASAFFLYGTALVYGGAGSTRMAVIADQVNRGVSGGRPLVVAGVTLVLVGLAFKVAAVPFHMWTPDVYEGAPAPVTGFMAAGSKAAGFAVLLRAFGIAFAPMVSDWRVAVSGLALITMVTGSLVAISQTNVKRMLAYSAIAHSGFILIGVAAGNARGVSGSLFYLAAYAIVIVGAFAVVHAIGGPGEERVNLDDYRGLALRRPFPAAVLALMLVSLAGVPPTAGFWAKFEVFSAGMGSGLGWLVFAGVLASAVAAAFYLRVIVLMFLEPASGWAREAEPTPPGAGLAGFVAAAAVAVLGVMPGPLLALARDATLLLR